jgi:hypothetical protein
MKFNRNDKRDANHSQIADHLRKHGFEVVDTDRPLDIYIYEPSMRVGGWAEIKVNGSKGAIKRSQIKFMSETRIPVQFVTDEQEAMNFACTFEGLSQKQKDGLAALLIREPAKKAFQPNEVAEAIKDAFRR